MELLSRYVPHNEHWKINLNNPRYKDSKNKYKKTIPNIVQKPKNKENQVTLKSGLKIKNSDRAKYDS